jgi:hypothetical protein
VVDAVTRPHVPLSDPDSIRHRRALAVRANASLPNDGSEGMQAPLLLKSYTVATLPTASDWESGLIYVSDEAGGATVAVSNGTNWVRVQDLATVS